MKYWMQTRALQHAPRTVFLAVLLVVVPSLVGQVSRPNPSGASQAARVDDSRADVRLDPVQIIKGDAGFSRWTSRPGPLSAITSVKTWPVLRFPPLAEIDKTSGETRLRLVVPPTTPVGDYQVEVALTTQGGQSVVANIPLRVEPFTIQSTNILKTPVILLNGWQASCFNNTASTLDASVGTFGQLASLLQSDGIPVAYFNNCSFGDVPIETLASELGNYIGTLMYTDGTPVTQVDLVAHSMGGLISRAYLAGIQTDGTTSPPPYPGVRKLILIATPNFGSFQATSVGTQVPEMIPGSAFLWNLARWNQRQDDLRGVDGLAIVGDAGSFYGQGGEDDGVVSVTSGSIGFAEPDQRTRIVPYCHVTPTLLTQLGMSCSGERGIADVDTSAHLTAQIVRSFLAGNSAWASIGISPSQYRFPQYVIDHLKSSFSELLPV